jgi:hypothetical protein
MRYAWKVSRLRHLIFATDRPIVLGGRAMALDRRNKRIEGESRMPEYVPALLKELATRDRERQRSTEKT